MKRVIILASVLMLGGCGHLLQVNLPGSKGAAPRAQAPPPKPICPGNLSADLQPEPGLPKGAGFPAPQTPEEGSSVSLYGSWLHDYAVWARTGWGRAADAKTFCTTP